jgi:hypothetical protein
MMTLYVSLDDIQLFSGRAGEEEARKIYPQIRAWSEESESRLAVWHAGQVFRTARTLEKTRLRDFYAVAVHHAALTLWVYGMVTSNTSRQSGMQTPVQEKTRKPKQLPSMLTTRSSRQSILLDAVDDKFSRAFIQLGHGVPGLQHPFTEFSGVAGPTAPSTDTFYALYNAKAVMSIAAGVLRGNFPQSKQGLPPLVENLASLMDELGKLSS